MTGSCEAFCVTGSVAVGSPRDEQDATGHACVLRLHCALLKLRREHKALQASDACACAAEAVDDDTIGFQREARGEHPLLIVARLRGSGVVRVPLLTSATRVLLDTEDPAFACGSRPPIVDIAAGSIAFSRPGAVLFEL